MRSLIDDHEEDRDIRVMSPTRWISTDGGPLLFLPAAKLRAWHGSYILGEDGDFVIETTAGRFAFRTDYDFENPRSDYERACGINGLVGPLTVDDTTSLVLNDHPLETTWRPLLDGGLFARVFTVEPDADVEAELATLGGHHSYSDEGITLSGGHYVLMDALDHGEKPERVPVPIVLKDGLYRVSTADVSTGGVHWVCIRLALT